MKYAAIKAAMYFFGAALGFTLLFGTTADEDAEVSDAQFFGIVFLLSALVAGFVFFHALYGDLQTQRKKQKDDASA